MSATALPPRAAFRGMTGGASRCAATTILRRFSPVHFFTARTHSVVRETYALSNAVSLSSPCTTAGMTASRMNTMERKDTKK